MGIPFSSFSGWSWRNVGLWAGVMLIGSSGAAFGADALAADETTTLLNAHNTYRTQHCAVPLAWSADLAASARQWASGC